MYDDSVQMWVKDDAHSAWIGWQDAPYPGNYGVYTFRTTIDLTGADVSNVKITGLWAADQYAHIDLNGKATGQSVGDWNWEGSKFPNLNPFSISDGFISGMNTLDFVVTMPDGYDGLIVRDIAVSM